MTDALFDLQRDIEQDAQALWPYIFNYLNAEGDFSRQVQRLNTLRRMIAEHSPFKDEPVDFVEWVAGDSVHANDYNPNSVAPPEMELLRLSITADGYTQPIVTMPNEDNREVIDGFHRNRVGKECADVRERVKGYLPVVTIREDRKDKGDRIAATIRHNRARGKHRVDAMSDIVIELKRRNWTDQRVAKELGMEPDEVLRLCQISGIAELFSDDDFSAAWDIVGPIDEETSDLSEEVAGIPEWKNPPGGAERILHTWDEWECYPAGFYDEKPRDATLSDDACTELYAQLLRDIPAFKAAMAGVLEDWPNSCEHYLSNERMNRIAWLGQSSLCYTYGIPRRFRSGYMLLTEDEKLAANMAALEYLNKWLVDHGEEPLATLEDAASKTEMDLY